MIEDKFLQSKCRNLLREYEDVLKIIIEREEKTLTKMMMDIDDKDQYKFLKKVFTQKGILEGMRRFLAKINEAAK